MSDEQEIEIGDRAVRLLSQAHREKVGVTFARCPKCGEIFQDDLPLYGSVLCPNCPGICVLRGLKEATKLTDRAA